MGIPLWNGARARWLGVVVVGLGALGSTAAAAQATTFTVANTNDNGGGSLRAAVASANAGTGGDTIVIPASATPYLLTSGELVLTKPVTIKGAGAAATVLSGGGDSRIFRFTSAGPNALSGVTLTAGRSTAGGGAISATGGAMALTAIVANDNHATGAGGALQFGGNGSSNDALGISASTFSNNTAGGYGGAVSAGGGGSSNDTLTITASTFSANSAGDGNGGGALTVSGGGGNTDTTSIFGSTLVGNSVGGTGYGGALVVAAQTVALADDTIDDNSAYDDGGLYAPSATAVVNTIISGNHAHDAATVNCGSALTSGGHNLESADTCGLHAAGDRTGANPLLGSLRDNGGPTPTQALLPGSPAIDTGAAVCRATDQRGVHRPRGAACDIGAFELALPSATTGAAGAIDTTSAAVSGAATTPEVIAGSAWFEYGTTTGYGAQTPAQALPAGSATPFAATLTGLPPGSVIHFRLVARTPDGTAVGADATFATLPGPTLAGPAPPPLKPIAAVAPVLSRLTISRASISVKGKPPRHRSATVSYTDSQPATTTLTVLRVTRGYRVGTRCAAARPKHPKKTVRRCTRTVAAGSFKHADKAGANRVTLTARSTAKALRAGSYVLRAVARAGNGPASKALSTSFRVVA